MDKQNQHSKYERVLLIVTPLILSLVLIYSIVSSIQIINVISGDLSVHHLHPYTVSNAARDAKDQLLNIDGYIHDLASSDMPKITYNALVNINIKMEKLGEDVEIIEERYLGDKKDVDALVAEYSKLQLSLKTVHEHVPHLVLDYMSSSEILDAVDDHSVEALVEDAQSSWELIHTTIYYLGPILEFADNKAEELYVNALQNSNNAVKSLYLNAAIFVISIVFFFVIINKLLQTKNQQISSEAERFQTALQESPLPIIIHKNGVTQFINKAWTRVSGYTIDDIPTFKEWRELAFSVDGAPTEEFLYSLYDLKEAQDDGEWRIRIKDGSVKHWHLYTAPLEGGSVLSTAIDVTNQKLMAIEKDMLAAKVTRSQERLKLISEINQELLSESDVNEQDILDKTLEKALTLTKSEFGYIYFYDEKSRQFTLNSWSKGVMDACSVMKKQTVYDLDKTGFWGEAVRQRKALILNDFQMPHPMKKGYPEGHVPIDRFMTTPIFEGKEIVAVVGVANKVSFYTNQDVQELQLLINQVWTNIKSKKYQVLNQKLALAIDQSPVSILITNTDGDIEYVNEYFTECTGYSYDEVIGKNPRILKSGEQSQRYYKSLWSTILMGETWSGELLNKKKDGTLFWESATISPVLNKNGEVMNFVAVKEDITLKKNQEKMIINSLKEKDILLAEIHHRVKNNMAIISGLLQLEMFNHDDANIAPILNNSVNRIQSIARVHEELYRSNSFNRIELHSHIKKMSYDILDSYHNSNNTDIEFMFELDATEVNINLAVPIGLLLNELLTNSITHAFHGMKKGIIYVGLSNFEDELTLTVRDDGIGMDKDIPLTSLGFTLIQVLVQQINGTIEHKNGVGFETLIKFKSEDLKGAQDSMYALS